MAAKPGLSLVTYALNELDSLLRKAAVASGFRVFDRKATLDDLAKHQTAVYLGYDDKALHVAYVCDVANLKSLALQRAVEVVEAGGLRGATWMLEDTELAFPLQIRLERLIFFSGS